VAGRPLERMSPAHRDGAKPLHGSSPVGEGFGNDKLVNIHSVIVVRIGQRALQCLFHVPRRLLGGELQDCEGFIRSFPANQADYLAQLRRGDVQSL